MTFFSCNPLDRQRIATSITPILTHISKHMESKNFFCQDQKGNIFHDTRIFAYQKLVLSGVVVSGC